MIIKVQRNVGDYCYERNSKESRNGDTFKIYENVTNEYGSEKYLVCKDFCSPMTIVGKFNNLEDAEMFCTLKNLTKDF